jgi:hypothetical protein
LIFLFIGLGGGVCIVLTILGVFYIVNKQRQNNNNNNNNDNNNNTNDSIHNTRNAPPSNYQSLPSNSDGVSLPSSSDYAELPTVLEESADYGQLQLRPANAVEYSNLSAFE